MNQQPSSRPADTLVFGGQQAGGREAELAPPALHGPRTAHNPSRAAARRARDRRRAAQRRSRVRMRAGSEALLAFLVLLGLTLLLIDLRTAAFAGPRSLLAGVIGPLQAGVDRVTDPPSADAQIVAENQRLLAELEAVEGDRDRLAELEALYALTSRGGQSVVGASIVARSPGSAPVMTATIDRGSRDGIAADEAVLASGGLVGRVSTVAAPTAVIRFVTDATSVIGGRLVGSSEAGIVRGTGDPGELAMELLDPLAVVRRGDTVVTYGSPGDGPFPPGLALGTVIDTGDPMSPRRILRLRPAADPTAVTVVAVVKPEPRP